MRLPLIGARPGSLLRRVYGRPGACLLRSLLPQLIELRPCRGVVIVETLAHSRVHVFVSLGPRFPASLLCGPAWAGLRLLRKCFYPVIALQCSVLLLQSAVCSCPACLLVVIVSSAVFCGVVLCRLSGANNAECNSLSLLAPADVRWIGEAPRTASAYARALLEGLEKVFSISAP